MYIGISALIVIGLYLLWINYKSSPKRIIKSLWDEIRANSKKIYDASETNDAEVVVHLNKENDEKGFIINSILSYYYGKDSDEYRHYKYD